MKKKNKVNPLDIPAVKVAQVLKDAEFSGWEFEAFVQRQRKKAFTVSPQSPIYPLQKAYDIFVKDGAPLRCLKSLWREYEEFCEGFCRVSGCEYGKGHDFPYFILYEGNVLSRDLLKDKKPIGVVFAYAKTPQCGKQPREMDVVVVTLNDLPCPDKENSLKDYLDNFLLDGHKLVVPHWSLLGAMWRCYEGPFMEEVKALRGEFRPVSHYMIGPGKIEECTLAIWERDSSMMDTGICDFHPGLDFFSL